MPRPFERPRAAAVRAAIKSVDPTQPILNVATMDDVVSATTRQRRFTFVLFQIFAGFGGPGAVSGVGMHVTPMPNGLSRTVVALGACR